jgi:hypothetical protein
MPKRCALYMRVSTVDQHPETQLHDLRGLAAQRGFDGVCLCFSVPYIVALARGRKRNPSAYCPAIAGGLAGMVTGREAGCLHRPIAGRTLQAEIYGVSRPGRDRQFTKRVSGLRRW